MVREKSSASEMTGRNLLDAAPAAGAKSDLGAAPAAGAKMNKAKMVKIALVSVLAMFILGAAAVSIARYNGGQLRAFIDKDSFLRICVVTHVTCICILAWFAATAPTPASRRSYAKATVTSIVQLALNLYLVLVVVPAEVQDTA